MTRDIISNVAITKLIECDLVAPTIDLDSDSVDMLGYEGLVFAVVIGESNDTLSGSVKIEIEVEESDDDSSFTDVADAHLSSYVAGTNDGCIAVIDAAAEDDVVATVQYLGTSRYVRVVINVTGTHTNGTPLTAVAIQGFPQYAPV